jgi:hypothetical protein
MRAGETIGDPRAIIVMHSTRRRPVTRLALGGRSRAVAVVAMVVFARWKLKIGTSSLDQGWVMSSTSPG